MLGGVGENQQPKKRQKRKRKKGKKKKEKKKRKKEQLNRERHFHGTAFRAQRPGDVKEHIKQTTDGGVDGWEGTKTSGSAGRTSAASISVDVELASDVESSMADVKAGGGAMEKVSTSRSSRF
jgi:hypothetical protein